MLKVEIRGNADLIKALRAFTPDLEKELRKELKSALTPVVNAARGFVPSQSPMSGWQGRSFSEAKFPIFNYQTITRNIVLENKVSKRDRNGFTSLARIINKSPAGAIYEEARRPQRWVGANAGGLSKGVSRSVNPNAGAKFIENLGEVTRSSKGQGRFIYRAWAENQGVAIGAANKAIDTAIRKFYARNAEATFSRAA
jgi:hypothetical protein